MWEKNVAPSQGAQVIKQTPQCQPCIVIMVMRVIEVPEASKAIQVIVITFGCPPQLDCKIVLHETGEMAQWFKELALTEPPISVPRIHIF